MSSMTDFRAALRRDFVSFIHRAFLELNPSTKLLMAPYIYLIADRLEQCRSG